jgi:hypothetical protein
VQDEIRFLLSEKRRGVVDADIYDVTGKLISSEQMFSDGLHSLKLSGSFALPNGIYLLKVRSGENVYVQRVMKIR